jgi:hypothetical protein
MAAHPILIVGDGVIEIPEELQKDPRYQAGARLELVPVSEGVRGESVPEIKGDWRRLRGIFKDHEINLNDELRKDRLAELASDERMLSGHSR